MQTIYVTRRIPESGIAMLRERGYEVEVSEKDGVLTREELIAALKTKPYTGVLSLLTDKIDGEIFDAVPSAKIFANYAVGFDNIDLEAAKTRGVTVTNTPGVLTDCVAEHTFALVMALAHRVVEADRFVRQGRYDGWAPMLLLGSDLHGKTLGILGAGKIGQRVAYQAHRGYDMSVIYYDTKRNEQIEKDFNARFCNRVEEVLKEADVVSVHVPLLDSTRHLINAERLALMKKNAYLINTSRGPIIDEAALVSALKAKTIRGAALDVFEREPELARGLAELDNVILTPHTASATLETRSAMSALAAENLIAFFENGAPPNAVA